MENTKNSGFTIVELLIIIVVVAILAAIVLVAYGGMQARAKDAKRQTDIDQLAKLLEIYYVENGSYPPFSLPGNIGINVESWREVNMPNAKDGILIPPDAASASLVNSTTPTKSQYGYHNAGTCGGTPKCAKVRLYWRDESGVIHTVIGSTG
jgi:type II secretory pathway pseudopilin PulG